MAWPKGVPRKKPMPEVREVYAAPPPESVEEDRAETLDPLATLKLKAETALDSRGHEMCDWHDGPGVSNSACTRCGGVVAVREKDEKKGIFHCDEKATGTCA